MDQKYIDDAVKEYISFFENNPFDRHGYTFLIADSRLEPMEKDYLLIQATTMYLRNEEKRKIQTDSFEGKLHTESKHGSLGCFGGQQFDAELDTKQGLVKVRFLVSEQTGMYRASSSWN